MMCESSTRRRRKSARATAGIPEEQVEILLCTLCRAPPSANVGVPPGGDPRGIHPEPLGVAPSPKCESPEPECFGRSCSRSEEWPASTSTAWRSGFCFGLDTGALDEAFGLRPPCKLGRSFRDLPLSNLFRGCENQNVHPPSELRGMTPADPFNRSAFRSTDVNPRPVPPIVPLTCAKGRKSRAASRGSSPMPVSSTANTISSFERECACLAASAGTSPTPSFRGGTPSPHTATISLTCPCLVNFVAFPTKLRIISTIQAGSANTVRSATVGSMSSSAEGLEVP
mmetsp:Transcript_58722/g.187322  ORF Transcript_58722/g.187322 Transcript_58722/m.187322 type:complete len:284 (+) Transcript_58722:67-918(+)